MQIIFRRHSAWEHGAFCITWVVENEFSLAPVPIPQDCVINQFTRITGWNEKRWWSDDRKRIYTWDSLHGEIEIFTTRGKHLGAMNCVGVMIKDARKGRTIDV